MLQSPCSIVAALRPSAEVKIHSTEPWLTLILQSFNFNRELTTPFHHQILLQEILSGEWAIWNLASLVFPTNPVPYGHIEAPIALNYQMIHVKAYIVKVDTKYVPEVHFKLTPGTINATVDYYGGVHPCGELQKKFFEALCGYTFRTDMKVLMELEKDGSGELSDNRSEVVKRDILIIMDETSRGWACN